MAPPASGVDHRIGRTTLSGTAQHGQHACMYACSRDLVRMFVTAGHGVNESMFSCLRQFRGLAITSMPVVTRKRQASTSIAATLSNSRDSVQKVRKCSNISHIDGNISVYCEALRENATQDADVKAKFFKAFPGGYGEHDRFLGVANPGIHAVAKQYWHHTTIQQLEQLLHCQHNEERLLGLEIMVLQYKRPPLSQSADTSDAVLEYRCQLKNLLLASLDYVNNWNLVDASAYRIYGQWIADTGMQQDALRELYSLAGSSDLWRRRTAIVATLAFIRKNDLMHTFQLAELLTNDDHDLIHKAVGWMLREAGKRDGARLCAFLDAQAATMPRTMLRYAIEKLPQQQRKAYLGMKANVATPATPA